jgi:hypothetical protein
MCGPASVGVGDGAEEGRVGSPDDELDGLGDGVGLGVGDGVGDGVAVAVEREWPFVAGDGDGDGDPWFKYSVHEKPCDVGHCKPSGPLANA